MRRAMVFKAAQLAPAGLLVSLALCLPAAQQTARAGDVTVSLRDLIRETQLSTPDPAALATVWWLPNEYWEAALASDPTAPPELAKKVVEVVGSYTMIAAIDGKIGPFGGIEFKPEAEVRSSISIVDSGGQAYYPIAASAINADTKNLLGALKPILTNMLGPMGENMNFFLFEGKDEKGGRLFDPRKDGRFMLKMGEKEFKWRLPLGSLIPAKTCPKCGETLSGAYRFCPWCGSPLTEKRLPQGLEN